MQGMTVHSWKERLPEIIADYKKEDIWNVDETVVFLAGFAYSGFGQKRKECKGERKK